MDKLLSVHPKKASKQGVTKKKPVKVVYISSPMMVKASASEFRALVQELTGQDADFPDPTKYPEIDSTDGDRQVASDATKMNDDDDEDDDNLALKVPVVVSPGGGQLPKRHDLQFEPLDDVFTNQMLESFAGLLPANFLFESAHVDVLRTLGSM